MKIMLELYAGPNHHAPTKEDMDKNIESQQRAIDNKKIGVDDVRLIDTLFILKAIREQLP